MAGFQPPNRKQLKQLAERHNLCLNEEHLDYIEQHIHDSLGLYGRLDELPEPSPNRIPAEREQRSKPSEEKDPHNAFVTKCRVASGADGPLSGYEVGLKDNIAVAGVEMTVGSKAMIGYVPMQDASVVARLLKSGAVITGKTNMHEFSFHGGAEPHVRNPRDSDRLASGSSSGSAVAVVTGDVDISLGTDQGGSIRAPAAWCGCVGHKPTWGLVPYTGVVALENTIDHVGPLANSVEDCARVLDAIAGYDPNDPRQNRAEMPTNNYTDSLTKSVEDLTIGRLREGFQMSGFDNGVVETVERAIQELKDAGASVVDVSTQWHVDGIPIARAIMNEGITAKIANEARTPFTKERYDSQLSQAFGKTRRTRAGDFPPPLQATLVLGEYLAEEYQGHYYAKAHNLATELTTAYDNLFEEVDLLAMPTKGTIAPEIDEDASYLESLDALYAGMADLRWSTNLAQFNVTGHPGISVPCGTYENMPVGLQLVGERFDDATVLRTAHAFERLTDWEEM